MNLEYTQVQTFKFWRIQYLPGRGGGAYVMQHHARPERDCARVRHPVEGSCVPNLRLGYDYARHHSNL